MQYGRVVASWSMSVICRYAVQIQHGKTVRMDKGHGKGQSLANWAFGLRFHKNRQASSRERCLRFSTLRTRRSRPGRAGCPLVIALSIPRSYFT